VTRSGLVDLQAIWEISMGEAREGDDIAQARRHWDLAMPLAERAGDIELQSLIHSIRARAATEHHEIGLAAQAVEADRELVLRSGNAQLIARNTYSAATLQMVLDDAVRAEALFGDAARHFAALGNRSWEADSLRHLAQVQLEVEHYAQALESAQRAVALFETLDDPVFLSLARATLARALAYQGRGAEALAVSRLALAGGAKVGAPDVRAFVLLQHARVLHRGGQTAAAWQVLEGDLAPVLGKMGAGWQIGYQQTRADVLTAQGRAAEAALAWKEVLRLDRLRAARVLDDRLKAQDAVLRAQRLQRENALLQERSRDAERALAAEAQARWATTLVVALVISGVLGWLLWLRRVNRRVAHAAAHDSLTGVLNRRSLLVHAAALLDSRRMREHPVAVVLVDVDHFKRVNDTRGHAAGDEVLRQVAGCLRHGLREGDLVARWGGEEFLLLLPATTLEQAHAIAERQRAAVAALSIVPAEGADPLHVTISGGVSAIDDGEAALDPAIERADQALYRAKHGGRDAVLMAVPPRRSAATLLAA
jgi:diguanylate cyclase (GGDEF)-like protein